MPEKQRLKVLDLFSGIGGFSLGLERTGGFVTEAFCEIDPYCRKVLNKHWPSIPIHEDVRTLHIQPGQLNAICGGFPCQDISLAGRGKGLCGPRAGLWSEYLRLIKEGQPEIVLIENSPMLRGRGLRAILHQLDEIGYDAEWHCIPASNLGAAHRRDRIWVIAYPSVLRQEGSSRTGMPPSRRPPVFSSCNRPGGRAPWSAQSNVARTAYGISYGVDRISSLGNAVVPQIPEAIGHAILKWLDEPI